MKIATQNVQAGVGTGQESSPDRADRIADAVASAGTPDVLLSLIRRLTNKGPVVLGGDFNAPADQLAKLLPSSHEDGLIVPALLGRGATRADGRSTDELLVSRSLRIESSTIVDGGVSDHRLCVVEAGLALEQSGSRPPLHTLR